MLGRPLHRARCAERRGRGLRFFPRVRRLAPPKWPVSRVLFRRVVAAAPARIIHLGDALLRRSSTQPAHWRSRVSRARASGGSPWTVRLCELAPGGACPAAGHPAVARGPLPHDFTLACASSPAASQRSEDHWPSAVWFLLRFPSGRPGSPLTTSLPCGARTFLPRAEARRRSSSHLRHSERLLTRPREAIAGKMTIRHVSRLLLP